jgi:hypothetical protein
LASAWRSLGLRASREEAPAALPRSPRPPLLLEADDDNDDDDDDDDDE